MFNVSEVLLWCFQYHYNLDKSNAATHCSPVRFSPLTFRIYQGLMAFWPEEEDITQEMAEVKSHFGAYEEDKGR